MLQRLPTLLLLTTLLSPLSACQDTLSVSQDLPRHHPQIPSQLAKLGTEQPMPIYEAKTPVLDFSLSDDLGQAPPALTPPSPSEALPDARRDSLLALLPPLAALPDDALDFRLRGGSAPPPLTGPLIDHPFPPPSADTPPPTQATPTGPTTLLRYQPEGDVPIAPRVSLTFSAPMVPLSSHDSLQARDLPVTLSPAIEGQWRWVGTETLFFDPIGRAPMATDFTVTVPPTLQDAQGQLIDSGHSFTFSTPPPSLVHASPSGNSVSLNPLFYYVFDQKISPEALLKQVQITAGDRSYTPVMADAATLKASPLEAFQRAAAHFEDPDRDGRQLAFTLTESLPTDTHVSVVWPPGAPSAEGPKRTTEPLTHTFKTYGPFVFQQRYCPNSQGKCAPGSAITLTFNHPIDEDSLGPKTIHVTPPVVGLEVAIHGRSLSLTGQTEANTTYRITVNSELRDTQGQNLQPTGEIEAVFGDAAPFLGHLPDPLILRHPDLSPPSLRLPARGIPKLRVRVAKVRPSHWPAFLSLLEDVANERAFKVPGEIVFDGRLGAADPKKQGHFTIDYGAALDDGLGHALIYLSADGDLPERFRGRMDQWVWVQSTRLAVDAFADKRHLHAWATDLLSGAPLEDALVRFQGEVQRGSGSARFPLPSSTDHGATVEVHAGSDSAFIPKHRTPWGWPKWEARSDADHFRWFVMDDRHLYQPNEEVALKGIIRLAEAGPKGALSYPGVGAQAKVSWTLKDRQRRLIAEGEAPLSPLGSFDIRTTLPETPNLGPAMLELVSDTASGRTRHIHIIQIEEFRRPEFELQAHAEGAPHLPGQSASFHVKASYFAGGNLAQAPIQWELRTRPATYRPPGHDDFSFGVWRPWWRPSPHPTDAAAPPLTSEGVTDQDGEHSVRVALGEISPPRPMSLLAQATVTALNRQTWSTTSPILVHPSTLYIGLRTPTTFVRPGEPILIDFITTDLDGALQDQVETVVTSSRLEWKSVPKKGYRQVITDTETCTRHSSAEPTRCTFKPQGGGTYLIRAEAQDAEGRKNESSLMVWVPGGQPEPQEQLTRGTLNLIPRQATHQPGEKAEVLIEAPFEKGHGLLLVSTSEVVSSIPFVVEDYAGVAAIPIEDWMMPRLDVKAYANGQNPDTLWPEYASGQAHLAVSTAARTLTVTLSPEQSQLSPGARSQIQVHVKDNLGRPVSDAEVALFAVDEAVLALSDTPYGDPIASFYPPQDTPFNEDLLRQHLLILSDTSEETEEAIAEMSMDTGGGVLEKRSVLMSAPAAGGMARMENAPPPEAGPSPSLRQDFNPLAFFAPRLMTDAQGAASHTFTLPDNLTRYRLIALVAAGPDHFGKGESNLTANLPLMVRPQAPRFLNFGDTFLFSAVVQSQRDTPMVVDIAARTRHLEILSDAAQRLTLPPFGSQEVLIPMKSTQVGQAQIQVLAQSEVGADAALLDIPVYSPATTEAFAAYTTLDAGAAAQPVSLPEDAIPSFGSLDIETSSTQLQALTDAVIYLWEYPYRAAEPIASRLLALAALHDTLDAFESRNLPSKEKIQETVEKELARLEDLQRPDGGFGYWSRLDQSVPFISVHVAHTLERLQTHGFIKSSVMVQPALRYLRDIRKTMDALQYGPRYAQGIEAYALYVRHRLGQGDPKRALSLLDEAGGLDKADLEVIGWLAPTLLDAGPAGWKQELIKLLHQRVTESASSAAFVTRYHDNAYLLLASDRRVDALLLDALIQADPQSDLIIKLVRGLLDHRQEGRWGSTQENAWVLLALKRYFEVYEKDTPRMQSKIWVGRQFAGSQRFVSRQTDRHQLSIPMSYLSAQEGPVDLTIAKEGQGRLYARMALHYAPATLDLKAANHGFHVERRYEAVDAPEDVQRQEDGSYVIRAGARVKVSILMHTQMRRTHVALVDPLPAGLEIIQTHLKGAEKLPPPSEGGGQIGGIGGIGPLGAGRHIYWWGPWYQFENRRDDRSEAFTSLLWEGVYTYAYYARATTAGSFHVPPTKAEEMYHPETFGRTGSDRVEIRF